LFKKEKIKNKKSIDKQKDLCYTFFVLKRYRDRGALHDQYRTRKGPPRPCEKGVGAEADAVARILAGSSENIRSVVASNCEGLSEA